MQLKLLLLVVISFVCLGSVRSAPIEENDLDFSSESENDSSEESNTDFGYEFSDDTIQIVNDLGETHTIYLNHTLESDDEYDFDNLSWIDGETEESHGHLIGGANVDKVSNDVFPKLYLRDEPDNPYDLTPVNGRDAPFDINHPTKVVIHGWLNNGGQEWMVKMKDKYFINGNYNVILVDWHKYALLEYTISARKTRAVGQYVAQVLLSLILADKIRVEDIHLTGHSLGAHVAGIAGKTILAQIGQKIGRITGLDPAGPLFEKPILCSKKKRLTSNDAVFVDVIHTDGGLLGFKSTVGHADFFPNEGKGIQPGCGLIKNQICSHLRSYQYYTESINTEKFVSTSCDSWSHYRRGKCNNNQKLSMGFYLDTFAAKGKYYLRTRSRTPFAKG